MNMAKKVLMITSSVRSFINFRYHLIKDFINKGYRVIACATPNHTDKNTFDLLQEIGVKYIPIQIENTGLNLFFDLRTVYNLFRLIKKEQPDLIFNYTIKPVIYGSIAARLAKIDSVYSTITGLGYIFLGDTLKIGVLRLIVKRMYAFTLKFNKKIFFQNPDDLNLFISSKIVDKSKTVLINGSGVDIDYYVSAPFPENCTFLLVARLIKDKGIYEYIKAAQWLKRKYPFVKFKLVGDYDANPSAIDEAEVKCWVTDGIIEYLGFLDNIKLILESSSVFVLPSYREGLPKVVLEAMASGRPIITTNAPGCRETVVNGKNGYLIPVRNVDKLIEAMEKFILSPELIPKMGWKSRCIAEEKYDVREVNRSIFKVIGIN
jgi:glycosyltransferase involved in cell wall biosynthesis